MNPRIFFVFQPVEGRADRAPAIALAPGRVAHIARDRAVRRIGITRIGLGRIKKCESLEIPQQVSIRSVAFQTTLTHARAAHAEYRKVALAIDRQTAH